MSLTPRCGRIGYRQQPPLTNEGDYLEDRVDRSFLARTTLNVARDLLGCRLVRILSGQRVSGLITAAELTNGPAKLCQALGIDRSLNGVDLVVGDELFVEQGVRFRGRQVEAGPRIGVRGDEAALTAPWRFVVK